MAASEPMQHLTGITPAGTWGAAVLMAAATLAGALIARRSVAQSSYLLAAASGMMLATALVDLLPEAWEGGSEAGVSLWFLAAVAVAGYLVMFAITRDGCGCAADSAAKAVGVGLHTRGLHRRVRKAAGALSAGLGTAVALSSHRIIEGTTLALAFSLPVVATLAIASASDGLALATMLRETGQNLTPWLAVTCVGPAVGVLITTVRPLPAVVLPVVLALVAGVILRIAAIGLQLVVQRRQKGRLAHWHLATALAAATAMGGFVLAAAH
ncbi:hypothetical protein [Streptomyces sp. NPDC059010]|uniref:hypothetical protein n=1 Tax=Streptomyces sp. NPDC059010 TaxID=3346695 RepID=UPI0036851181